MIVEKSLIVSRARSSRPKGDVAGDAFDARDLARAAHEDDRHQREAHEHRQLHRQRRQLGAEGASDTCRTQADEDVEDVAAQHIADREVTAALACSDDIDVERYVDGTVVGFTSLTSKRWTDIRTGAVWSTQDPNGAVVETTRDGLGRPMKMYDALGVEVVAYTCGNDGLPDTTTDDNTLPTTTTTTWTSTTIPRTAKQTVSVADGAGNVVRSYVFDLTGSARSNGERVEFHERDSDGRDVLSYLPASTISAPLATAPHVTFTYDALGRVLTETAPDVARVTEYSYAPRYHEVTDPAGVTTTTISDRRGEPITVERSAGALVATTHWHRDGLGQLVGLTDADGNVQRFEYDRGGNLHKWTLPHAPSVAASGTFTKCHDAEGRVLRALDADGRETSMTYDKLGRPVVVEVDGDYSGTQTYTMSYDATGAGARLGRMWRSTDAIGATENSFDANGRPTSSLRSFTTMAGINRIKTTPTWGLQGELKTLNVTGGVGTTVTTQLGAISVSYSPRGRLTTLSDAGTQLLGNVVYDAFGQPSSFGVGAIPTQTAERVTATFTRKAQTRDIEGIRYSRPTLQLADIKLSGHGKDGSPVIAPLGAAAAVTSREGFDIFREGAEITIQSPNKLSGIMGTFDKATGELSVEMVEVAEKGVGIGRELYARLLREVGFSDVTSTACWRCGRRRGCITGKMGFDNAKVLKAGGSIDDMPRAKILDPLTFGNHTY